MRREATTLLLVLALISAMSYAEPPGFYELKVCADDRLDYLVVVSSNYSLTVRCKSECVDVLLPTGEYIIVALTVGPKGLKVAREDLKFRGETTLRLRLEEPAYCSVGRVLGLVDIGGLPNLIVACDEGLSVIPIHHYLAEAGSEAFAQSEAKGQLAPKVLSPRRGTAEMRGAGRPPVYYLLVLSFLIALTMYFVVKRAMGV